MKLKIISRFEREGNDLIYHSWKELHIFGTIFKYKHFRVIVLTPWRAGNPTCFSGGMRASHQLVIR
jgi:hypothetical protein